MGFWFRELPSTVRQRKRQIVIIPMTKEIPLPTPQLNRLRAAAGLIPIIESGLSDGAMSAERVAQMMLFCEWAVQVDPQSQEETRLVSGVAQGIERLNTRLATELDVNSVAR